MELILGGTLGFKKFAIFASGLGSNALNLISYARENADKFSIEVLVTDKEDAPVIKNAQMLGVTVEVIPFIKTEYPKLDKKNHEEKILEALKKYNISWVVLAGYMKILSPQFLNNFYDQKLQKNRVLNIHPSLLPNFPGKDGYGDAFSAGVPVSGVTVHFVDSGIDAGPIFLQRSFERFESDTLEDFISRGKKIEHELYREAVKLVAEDRI
jgi:phosphoribosylglycinamide formyltransferase-1